MLYGDDDTVFFLDNVVALLDTLDWRLPYLLSDSLWWPEGGSGVSCYLTITSYQRAHRNLK